MAHFRFSGVSERTRRTNSDAVEAEAESEGAAGAEAANGEDNGATVSSCGEAEGVGAVTNGETGFGFRIALTFMEEGSC